MWVNAESKVVIAECNGEKFILPPLSSFIINDVSVSRSLIKCKFIYGRATCLILINFLTKNLIRFVFESAKSSPFSDIAF